jgi:hypothetical protein
VALIAYIQKLGAYEVPEGAEQGGWKSPDVKREAGAADKPKETKTTEGNE